VTLPEEHCRPIPKGTPALPPAQAKELARQVPAWRLEGERLARGMEFKDFGAALAFVNAVGKLAEAESHHPDLHLTGYKRLRIETSTHSVGGLSRNDFVLAAKVDRLPGVPA